MRITAPKHLSKPAKESFKRVVADYALDDQHLKILTHACEQWDIAEKARLALAEHGSLTYTDRYDQPRSRPEVDIIRQCHMTHARLIRELCLDTEGGSVPEFRAPRLATG